MIKKSPLIVLILFLLLFATACETNVFAPAQDETPVATVAPVDEPEEAPTVAPQPPTDGAGPADEDTVALDPAAADLAETVWMWAQFQDTAGINDILDAKGAFMAEWPEHIEAFLPADRLWIAFRYLTITRRSLRFSATGPRSTQLLKAFRQSAFGK